MKERETVQRGPRDGEAFLRLKHIGRGHSTVRLIEPDLITEPQGKQWANDQAGAWSLDWMFGVGTEPGDVETVYGYHLDYDGHGRDCEFVPEGEMVHFRRNVDSTVKRGISDFYATAIEIEQANKVNHNVAEGAAIQAAIAWIREHAPGVTGRTIDVFSGAKADTTQFHPVRGGGTAAVQFKRYRPGTVLDVPAGQQYKAGPMGAERNQGFTEAVQMVLRRVGTRWSMPEYMISGDSSNANYSSTMVAESPWVKSVEAQQVPYGEGFTELAWKAVEMAHRWDRFARFGLTVREIKRLVQIVVDYPRVSVRNRIEDTTIREKLVNAGVMSRKTWASQEDLDYDEEVAAGAEAAELSFGLPGSPPPVDPQLRESDQSFLARMRSWLPDVWRGYP
jgi:hypothetical protein